MGFHQNPVVKFLILIRTRVTLPGAVSAAVPEIVVKLLDLAVEGLVMEAEAYSISKLSDMEEVSTTKLVCILLAVSEALATI